jgi:ribosomal protein L11 methyltransferase
MTTRSSPAGTWRLRVRVPGTAVDQALELLAASGSVGTWSRLAGYENGLAPIEPARFGQVPEQVQEQVQEQPTEQIAEQLVDAWFASATLPAGLRAQLEALGAGGCAWSPAEDRDWLEEYRRSARPVRVGRFELDPREPEAGGPAPLGDAGRHRLLLPARRAFGTGSHETTRLVVEALEELELAGRSVLDVGTGTGVLCFVARRLGAGAVVGLDLDPVAALLAAQNGRLNRIRVPFLAGSIETLSRAARFDVVLVNVLPENLRGAEREIADRVEAEGDLLVSGILTERAREIEGRWRALGLEPVASRALGEWTGLHLRRVRR